MDTKFQMVTVNLSNADSSQFRESGEFRAAIVEDAKKAARGLLCAAQRSVVWVVRGQGDKLQSGREAAE